MYPIEAPSPITSLHFFPAPGPEQTDHCIQNKDPDLLSRHRAEKATEKPRKTAKSCKTLPFGTYGKEIKITCQKVRNTCTQAQIGRTMHQELRFLVLHSGPGKPHHWKLEYDLSILQLQPSQSESLNIEQFVQRVSLQHSVFEKYTWWLGMTLYARDSASNEVQKWPYNKSC